MLTAVLIIFMLAFCYTALQLMKWVGVVNVRLNELRDEVRNSKTECKFYPQEMPTIKEVHKVIETSTAAEFMSGQYRRVNEKFKKNDTKV